MSLGRNGKESPKISWKAWSHVQTHDGLGRNQIQDENSKQVTVKTGRADRPEFYLDKHLHGWGKDDRPSVDGLLTGHQPSSWVLVACTGPRLVPKKICNCGATDDVMVREAEGQRHRRETQTESHAGQPKESPPTC
ncbi:hypothetical protein EWB00_000524 [Schistosoma japonicum]|uniref:Uncharacterized protein n=1 Tax=Schistosoma japonicum TaxID=6182 RepID=A0A4Z2CK69_SCHJA|nr:hypothetical protein EWB00_000524 [Schistosoma japonicum]